MAIDKYRPDRPLAHIVTLDLTVERYQSLVLSWLAKPQVRAVFLAPPCGTASAARNIILEGEQNLPKPLRTWEMPDGLPDLPRQDAERVAAANVLYQFTADVMRVCIQNSIPCFVENPRNSMFWFVTPWMDLIADHPLFVQDHQACMYGSGRPKWTRLASNVEEVFIIDKVCDHSHEHLPWGVIRQDGKRHFATALEVHYPQALCEAIVHALTLAMLSKGLNFHDAPSLQHTSQTAAHFQTTKNAIPPLVPAYRNKALLLFDSHNHMCWPFQSFPLEDAKLLHEFSVGETSVKETWKRIKAECEFFQMGCPLEDASFVPPNAVKAKIFGFHWSPEEFVEQADKAIHPLSELLVLPEVLAEVVTKHSELGVAGVAKQRVEFFKRWTARARSLADQEQALRSSMDPQVEKIVAGKRLLLFGELLEEYSFPDSSVIDELREGAHLVGEVPKTGMLPAKFVPAVMTPEGLKEQSRLLRPTLEASPKGSGDNEVDRQVWEQSLQEAKTGWISGPMPSSAVPETAPLARRFGLKQKTKTRLIDDFSVCGVNATACIYESPTLHTIDVAASLLSCWFAFNKKHGNSSQLLVRTFDLTSAYRQVGIHPDSREFAYIRVFNPEEMQWAYFQCNALPFGATRSVHSFLRLARAVWWLGSRGCLLPWTNFYDDFILISPAKLAPSAEKTAAALFKLLGWFFAEEGRKCVPFSEVCEALGVLVDLSESTSFVAKVRNTKSRVAELSADLQDVLNRGFITKAESQRLRGRMIFAESQLFGRTGKRGARALALASEATKKTLSARDRFFLSLFIRMLEEGEPRVVKSAHIPAVQVYTDACYEADSKTLVCGLGGVYIDKWSNKFEFFSVNVCEEWRVLLGANKRQLIFEAETLAAVVATILWAPQCLGRKLYLFVDNEGTKFSLLKGFSDNWCVDWLACEFAKVEARHHILMWLARVPSKSNPSDEPSRGSCECLLESKYSNVSNAAYKICEILMTALKNELGETAVQL